MVVIMVVSMPSYSANGSENEGNKTHRLSDLKWDARLVLTSVSDLKERDEILKVYKINKAAFDERKLIIFVVSTNQHNTLDVLGVSDKSFSAQDIKQRLRRSHTLLIGLDGGNKVAYDTFDMKQIFADIDSMPMRRAEIDE